jgi:citrate lyase subunit beta/citryl-CoA lyase
MADDPRMPAILFCPADRPERFAKAAGSADTVVLDLEDGVAPESKDTARAHVVASLDSLDPRRTIIRINPPGTPYYEDDLDALPVSTPTVIMLPKAESPEMVRALAPHRVIGLCETAAGVMMAPAIAAAPNCIGLMLGGEDLAVSVGLRRGGTSASGRSRVLDFARHTVLFAARMHDRLSIDSVVLDIEDHSSLLQEAQDAATTGFSGKACIHPSQIQVVKRGFRPSGSEITWARSVIAMAVDRAVFRFEGQLVDAPVLAQARAILASADCFG